jgi:translation initiation factor IF-2
MSKMRVHELAQKMGIENKELIVRLKAVGVVVSNHMAALDDDVVKKLQAPPTVTVTVKDVSQEETRVSSTVIRRRAKVVEKVIEVPAEEPPVKEPEVVEPVSEPVAEAPPEIKAKPVAKAKPAEPEVAPPEAPVVPVVPAEPQ